jgi:UDP-arabinose 4-epimerase
MKTILVTGGAGFVGSHACKALSRAGYLPLTFDNLERGHERAVKWGPLERGDLRHVVPFRQTREFGTHRWIPRGTTPRLARLWFTAPRLLR